MAEAEAARKAAEEEAARKAAEEEATRKAAEEAARKAAEEEAARKAAEEEAARKAAEAPEPDADGFVETAITGDNAISFKCTTCGQEIIAPGEAVGYEAECPACGAILLVPSASEPGTTYASDGSSEQKEQLKSRTIRIDALMFDEEVNTTPSTDDKLSEAMKSRTMRIDLPDEF